VLAQRDNAGLYAGASLPVAQVDAMLPRAAAARSLPCSIAGSAGFYASASHPVARAARVLPRAAASMLLPTRSTRAALASTLARATLWREWTRLLPRRWLQSRCCARSTRAALASTLALATWWRETTMAHTLAQATLCGAKRHMCCLGRRLRGRCRARSTRAALASMLARRVCCLGQPGSAGFYAGTARVLPGAAAARPPPGYRRARPTRALLASTLA